MAASTTSTAQNWPQLLDLPFLHDDRPFNQMMHNYAPLQLSAERVKELFANSNRASVYLHVPFCRELCNFCNCNIVVTKQYSLASQYIEALRKEINWYGEALASSQVSQSPLLHLYIGGGTPTYLMHDDFRKLFKTLNNNFRLTNAPSRDYTIEVDPRNFDQEIADQIVELGFNRIHIGLEDFSEEVQQATNRKYSVQKVEDTFALARKAGIQDISVDLVYGLPHQTKASVSETINQIARLLPTQVFMRLYQSSATSYELGVKDASRLDLKTLLQIQESATEYWLAQDYRPLGSLGFCKKSDSKSLATDSGEIFVAQRGYTRHRYDSQLGFGLGTTSSASNYYWENQTSLREYTKQILKSGNAAYQGVSLSQDDQMRLEVANNLLCNQPLDKIQFAEKWHCSFNQYFSEELNRLSSCKASQLINNNESNFHIRPEGLCHAQKLASVFLANPETP